jgi:hypothetical protein
MGFEQSVKSLGIKILSTKDSIETFAFLVLPGLAENNTTGRDCLILEMGPHHPHAHGGVEPGHQVGY